MHFWASRGTSVTQLAQKCFCQQAIYHTTYNVKYQKYNNLYLARYYCIRRNYIGKTSVPVTQFLPLLTKMSSIVKSYPNYSTSSEDKEVTGAIKLSTKDKLKRAVKDYGGTVMVFHISISLVSLGLCYSLISSGVDVASLLDKVGLSSSNQLATGASTFVVAYAVHKMLAPFRISITIGCTPFIVRYLRAVGILKPPKPSPP